MSRQSSSERTAPHLGGARISNTQWGAVQHRATPGTTRPALSAGLLAGLLGLVLGAALAAAAPAAAADDAVRPDARVTHGPSCRPGGLVVEVVGGTAPYSVRLATTRRPAGEADAVVQPGKTVELHTDDVDWGETIDGRLEFSALNGSDTYVDELEEYSFTRPTKEDCDAVAESTAPDAPPPTSAPGSSTAPQTSDDVPATSAPSTSTTPGPTGGAGSAGSGGGDDDAAPAPQQVVAGDTVTLQAGGFLPGERVTITLDGSDAVLGSAVAGPDGTVHAQVRIPAGTAAGPASVALVGDDSAVARAVELRVAAAATAVDGQDDGDGVGDLVPLTAAAAALVLTVGALVSVAGHQRSGDRPLRRA